MMRKLGQFAFPPLLLVFTLVSALLILSRGDGNGSPGHRPLPALGSPTLVFSLEPKADPQAVAVRLAGPAARAYSYATVCAAETATPPRFIVPLVRGTEDAVLARARGDADVHRPTLSVWPCGAGL